MADLNIHVWAVKNLDWSPYSPQEGTPACTCMLCGQVIGFPESDGRWEAHDPHCIGCVVCETAVRLFRSAGKEMREQRYHTACFAQVLVRMPELGPVKSS